MEQRDYLTGLAVLIMSASAAFGMGSLYFGDQQPRHYSKTLNATVNADQPTRTVEFDNHSIQLMFEDRETARMYIDKDNDGSFDIELEDLERNGEIHSVTELVTLGNTSYRLHFRYKDNDSVRDDAWLTLYQVQEV